MNFKREFKLLLHLKSISIPKLLLFNKLYQNWIAAEMTSINSTNRDNKSLPFFLANNLSLQESTNIQWTKILSMNWSAQCNLPQVKVRLQLQLLLPAKLLLTQDKTNKQLPKLPSSNLNNLKQDIPENQAPVLLLECRVKVL